MNQLIYKEKGNPEFLSKLDKLNLPVINPKYATDSLEVRSSKCLLLTHLIAYKSSYIKNYVDGEPTEKERENLRSYLVTTSCYLLKGSNYCDSNGVKEFIIFYCKAMEFIDLTSEVINNVFVDQHDLLLDLTNTISEADKQLRSRTLTVKEE